MMRLTFMHPTFLTFSVAGVVALVIVWEALLKVIAGVACPTSVAIPVIPGMLPIPGIPPMQAMAGMVFMPCVAAKLGAPDPALMPGPYCRLMSITSVPGIPGRPMPIPPS